MNVSLEALENLRTAGLEPIAHHDGKVLEVRLRQQRFGYAAIAALADFIEGVATLSAEASPRVLLFSSAQADFSHGANLTDGELARRMIDPLGRLDLARRGQRFVEGLRRLPLPTVAAASGHIVGAGACLFCACDFRWATPDARVRFPEVERGMHLSWGIVPILVHIFGADRAASLAVAGDDLAASELGPRACRTVEAGELHAQALAFAAALAAKPPLAVRSTLAVLRRAVAGDSSAANDDATLFADTVASADFAEAMAAFFAKRPGTYLGR